MLIKCGFYKRRLSAEHAAHFKAFTDETIYDGKVEELSLCDYPPEVIDVVCDYSELKSLKLESLNDTKLGANFVTGLSEEQRLISTRMDLRQLAYCAKLCLYLDFDEMLAIALSRLAYCLGAGDKLQPEPGSGIHIESGPKSGLKPEAASWFKPRSPMCWETYFSVKAMIPDVLSKYLSDTTEADMMRLAPPSVLCKWLPELSVQRLFEMAVEHLSDSIGWLLKNGAVWTHELIASVFKRSLAMSRKYLDTMPVELLHGIIPKYTVMYRDIIDQFKTPVRVDVDWLIHSEDWIAVYKLLSVAGEADMDWIATEKFLGSPECAALAQPFPEIRRRFDIEPREPTLVKYCLGKEIKSLDPRLMNYLVLSSDYAKMLSSMSPAMKRELHCLARGCMRSTLIHNVEVYSWAMDNDLMPKSTTAAISMILNGSFDVFVNYFGPDTAYSMIEECVHSRCLCDKDDDNCRSVYSDGILKDEVVLPLADHPMTLCVLSRTSDVAAERMWLRYTKTSTRDRYLTRLADMKDFPDDKRKYYEALAPEAEPQPRKGNVIVCCSDSRLTLLRSTHDKCTLIEKKTDLTKKQMKLFLNPIFYCETPGTFESMDKWYVACCAGHKEYCLLFARLSALNLGQHPLVLEEMVLSESFKESPQWMSPWPGIEKMRIGPGLKRHPKFFELAPERLREWIKAVVHEDCLPQ